MIAHPRVKTIVRKWITKEYRVTVKVQREVEYKTSFLPVINLEENSYNARLKDFVQKLLEVLGVLKNNNFEQKYKDYTSALKK